MSKTLLILIGGHFALGPRPQKEAAAAKLAGFRVIVCGVWWDDSLAIEDLELARSIGVEFKPLVDLRRKSLRTIVFRLKQRLARDCFQWGGVVSPRCFGLAGPEMLEEALKIRPDLTMVHSEPGLWVGWELLKRGLNVGVDFEDWFSEDLPPADREGRPVAAIKELEGRLLKQANPVWATTRAMAEAMANEVHCERDPAVVPNCFPWRQAPVGNQSHKDSRDPHAVSFYWFSQTIGPGRGLETLARALKSLQGDWELQLRGSLRGYATWFDDNFPPEIRHRVRVLDMVPNSELASRSASHDVGLALEEPHCPSRDLTATNKIFEYLRCGLAVIATSTRGQIEVMERCPDVGWVIPPGDSAALAEVMQRCLDDRQAVTNARHNSLLAASGVWAWERFEGVIGKALLTAAGTEAGTPRS